MKNVENEGYDLIDKSNDLQKIISIKSTNDFDIMKKAVEVTCDYFAEFID